MAQRPTFDIHALSNADRLVLGGAGAYFVWSLFPLWYQGGHNGWSGITLIAAVTSVLALGWAILRIPRLTENVNLNVKPGMIDLGAAYVGLLFTAFGLAVKAHGVFGFRWGLVIGLLLALAWAYGAYMKYSEPADAAWPPSGRPGTRPVAPSPPPQPGGGEARTT